MARRVVEALPPTCKTYYEPFVGGGAVFLELWRKNAFKKAVLGDTNVDLITAYQVVQSDVESLIVELSNEKWKYDRETFLQVRSQDAEALSPLMRAARFLFLNRTCFNGLYRVNKDGRFNTPFGRYTNPLICDSANLRAWSVALQGVKLILGDFHRNLRGAKSGDAVYIDPPYIPLSKTSSFTGYSAAGFTRDDHRRLSEIFSKLVSDGVRCVASNSSSELTPELYAGHTLISLMRPRCIGGPASYRNSVSEFLIIGNSGEPSSVSTA